MRPLLVDVLLDPARADGLDMDQYRQLIAQARSTDLPGTLACRLEQAGMLEQLPYPVRRHLDSARQVYLKTIQDVAYEVSWLRQAFEAIGERLILLKGAAYIQAGLPPAPGRALSDIDLLIPAPRLAEAEASLARFGWHSGNPDPYTERYYRDWMHEIPPLMHYRRGTVVDLHHTILPPTAAPAVDAALLFTEVAETAPGVFRLSDRDLVIHSATHLFHEGEFHHGLRDLFDLDRMLRSYSSADPGFWPSLFERARQLDLLDSLIHGLNYARQVFDTPVDAGLLEAYSRRLQRARKPLMDFLFTRAFQPDQPACRRPFTGPALTLLYVRSHYLRMPLYLLAPHLIRKAWKGWTAKAEEQEDAAAGGRA